MNSKIAIPIIEDTKLKIINHTRLIAHKKPNFAEWRIDYFLNENNLPETIEIAKKMHQILKQIPLIITLRTEAQGGQQINDRQKYYDLVTFFINNQLGDYIDLEFATIGDKINEIIALANSKKIQTIVSHHDFADTPDDHFLKELAIKMADTGADIIKIAVMPRTPRDVINLMLVTNELNTQLDIPIISMAMGQLGKISRISGALTGSMMTFASLGQESAPGQIEFKELQKLLNEFQA